MTMRLSFALAVGIFAAFAVFAAPAPPGPKADVLKGLRPEHPRLIATSGDWKALKEKRRGDPELDRILRKIEAQAREDLDAAPLVYKKEGRRLLAVSREALRRILFWSSAWRLTGERAFAARAEQEMLNLACFQDWNPSHFLDTAEMTGALAFGYDWLYDQLPESSRAAIRTAIVEKGLRPGLRRNGWHTVGNNWNEVCFGGLTLGALAVADVEPEPARQLLEMARTNNIHGLRPYAPDGIYPEGPGYWGYGTSYEVLMITALQSALGTDWNLSASPGFMASAAAQVEMTGPSGRPFNFSDCGERAGFQPAMFWFAEKLAQPELVFFQKSLLDDELQRGAGKPSALLPLVALWWRGDEARRPVPTLPRLWRGEGLNPVGIFRASWSDPNALFVAFKAGSPSRSHAHMDAGSFVLDALGVRWACDLGAQDYYSLESKNVDLWNGRQDGQRWQVFRLNNFSHSTLTLDGQLHRVSGQAKITEFREGPEPRATLDLSEIFAGQAERVTRQFQLRADGSLLIRDNLSGMVPGKSIRWAMVTRAQVKPNGASATLQQEGKQLHARALSPAEAKFSFINADPPQDGFNAPNPGAGLLIINLSAPADGRMTIEVALKPGAG